MFIAILIVLVLLGIWSMIMFPGFWGIDRWGEEPPPFNVVSVARFIDNGTGCELGFGNELLIYQKENGKYVVSVYDYSGDGSTENSDVWFANPYDAAEYFLEKRVEMKLGYDFEGKKPTNK